MAGPGPGASKTAEVLINGSPHQALARPSSQSLVPILLFSQAPQCITLHHPCDNEIAVAAGPASQLSPEHVLATPYYLAMMHAFPTPLPATSPSIHSRNLRNIFNSLPERSPCNPTLVNRTNRFAQPRTVGVIWH